MLEEWGFHETEGPSGQRLFSESSAFPTALFLRSRQGFKVRRCFVQGFEDTLAFGLLEEPEGQPIKPTLNFPMIAAIIRQFFPRNAR